MPRLLVVLDITGDAEDAFEAVDNALDNGALQDAINDYKDDSDDDEDDNDVADNRSSVHVTSAVVRSPSDLIDVDATTRALRALGIEGNVSEPMLISRSQIRAALLAALEGGE